MMQKTSTTQVRRIILVQLATTLALSVVLLAVDLVHTWSSLAGGLIATLANAYFAWKVFAKQQESEPEQILATYYRAEVSKVILTVMLFVAAIVMIKPLSMLALIGAYLVNTMIPWLVSYFSDDSETWRVKNGR
ncbi:MAG: ATP synthase subunit I [Gammaproteobacteria bacterium]|nr:ATP synthase subunit I [Gammaproteobacteria bacterium]